MLGLRWNLEAKRACFCPSGDFKTYDNPWEEKNKEIPTQYSMRREGQVWFPAS
jgi:hypothetical protein